MRLLAAKAIEALTPYPSPSGRGELRRASRRSSPSPTAWERGAGGEGKTARRLGDSLAFEELNTIPLRFSRRLS